jgi:hypothetical protein
VAAPPPSARSALRDIRSILSNAALVGKTVSRLGELRHLTIVAVTPQTDLVRRLGGGLLYLVG